MYYFRKQLTDKFERTTVGTHSYSFSTAGFSLGFLDLSENTINVSTHSKIVIRKRQKSKVYWLFGIFD